ncbi:MAG: T9SS type A sorting domain-containing protein [Gammaproteobacteria bacterium]|nr:T9SS type A sorting domain-containing protein [Gammaproteobacteria bacterium]
MDIEVGNPIQAADLVGVSFHLAWNNTNFIDGVTTTANGFFGPNPLLVAQNFADHIEVGVSSTTGGKNGSGIAAHCTLEVAQTVSSNTDIEFNLTNLSGLDGNGNAVNVIPDNNPLTITLTTGICVWPGDANNDGIANAADVLPLGLFFNQTGPSRTSQGCLWECKLATPWSPNQSTTYADCNGDGIVNAADVLCIGLNFGQTHTLAKMTAPIASNTEPFTEEELTNAANLTYTLYDLQNRPISVNALQSNQEFYVGVDVTRSSELFGVSFAMDWLLSDSDGAELEVVDSWSENGIQLSSLWGENALSIARAFNEEGRLEIGAVRIDEQSINQQGELLRVRMRMVNPGSIAFSFKDINAIDANGEAIAFVGNTLNAANDPLAQQEVKQFSLSNYPNPFNPTTRISFGLPVKTKVHLVIYNALGQEVLRLVDAEYLNPGIYNYDWDASRLPSGIYFYRLRTKEYTHTQKMMLLK